MLKILKHIFQRAIWNNNDPHKDVKHYICTNIRSLKSVYDMVIYHWNGCLKCESKNGNRHIFIGGVS